MKWFFAFASICLTGCSLMDADRYNIQIEEVNRRLADDGIVYLNGTDVWGRKWELVESISGKTNDYVEVFRKYRSHGQDPSNDKDDIEVMVHQHFYDSELISWGYSYEFENGNSFVSGGCEFD